MRFEFSELTFPVIPNRLEGQRFERFKADISSLMFEQRLEIFNSESSTEGPWKPLSQVQAENRSNKLERVSNLRLQQLAGKGFRHVKILQDTGILRQSFTKDIGPGNAFRHTETGEDFVRISTHVKYARIQNQGGTIVPINGKALVFTGPDGRKIFAKKVTIPARPFDQFTDANEEDLAELTYRYLNGRF